VLHEPRRTYPQKQLAAQIVGFANIDGVGVRGIEQQEDDWLRGTARWLPAERDARGRLLISGGGQQWSTAGGDIALTLDATLQAEAEAALREAVEQTGAQGGVAISMDPHSGDILALAEVPAFDPNHFRSLEYKGTRSRAFLDAAEPGSTLKAFLVAAALEKRAVTGEDRFDCENGSFRVPGKTIRDAHPHGVLSTAEILRVSSNIGATKIARALGAHAYHEMLRRFGFGASTQSGFPDESAGVLRPWRRWTDVDHATIAFGQGVNVTAIQLAAATAALANGGHWVRPRLVAARRAADGSWRPTEPERVRRVVSPETAAAVMAMLERSAGPEGTGRRAALRGVRIAGKTGTAQKFDRESGRYAQDRFRAWFIGTAPADEPKLVIVTGSGPPILLGRRRPRSLHGWPRRSSRALGSPRRRSTPGPVRSRRRWPGSLALTSPTPLRPPRPLRLRFPLRLGFPLRLQSPPRLQFLRRLRLPLPLRFLSRLALLRIPVPLRAPFAGRPGPPR
jgi:cell division protein FtsI (penicillin-binding protein 3)